MKDFFSKAFTSVGITVNKDAMEFLVQFSSGLPVMMHELGDATFWQDKDNIISVDDVVAGITAAADNVCKKYLTPKVYQAIRSENYKTILNKLGNRETWITSHFRRKEVESTLSDKEKKVFDNFLRKMRQLGVIQSDPDKGPGDYVFTNDLYPVCFHFKGQNLNK